MKTFKKMLLLALLIFIAGCTSEETAAPEPEEAAFTSRPDQPGRYGTLITWKPVTTIQQRDSIRSQYSHLFLTWSFCDFETEIWWEYCADCRPFQDPLNDPSGRVNHTQHVLSCPD